MKKGLGCILAIAAFMFVACGGDSSSAPADEHQMASSSSLLTDDNGAGEGVSSSFQNEPESSGAQETGNLSSSSEVAQGGTSSDSAESSDSQTSGSNHELHIFNESKVMPSGTYDCSKYTCVTTEYLNQKLLEAGKYGEILDERDNQVYKTIQIGDQVWMAQNLNFEYVEYESDGTRYSNRHYYRDDSTNFYMGGFYTWSIAVDANALYSMNAKGCFLDNNCKPVFPVQGLCPFGWHLPDTTEYNQLFEAVGGIDSAMFALRASKIWRDLDAGGDDDYGFSALAAGTCSVASSGAPSYSKAGSQASFWTSTSEYVRARAMTLTREYSYGRFSVFQKADRLPIRCVKNVE